jgi:hypothetical protein
MRLKFLNALKALFFCLSMAIPFSNVSAQWENTQFHLGGSYDFLRIQAPGFQTFANYFTVSGGTHYVFWQSNDQVSLSVNPNASLGVSFNNITGLSFFGQAPVFAMMRVGAASTKYNQQRFGAGLGAGFLYAYVHEKGFFANNRFYTLESNIVNPAVAAQITFQNDFRILTVRAYTSLLSYSAPFIEIYGNDPFNYDMFGISLLYNF